MLDTAVRLLPFDVVALKTPPTDAEEIVNPLEDEKRNVPPTTELSVAVAVSVTAAPDVELVNPSNPLNCAVAQPKKSAMLMSYPWLLVRVSVPVDTDDVMPVVAERLLIASLSGLKSVVVFTVAPTVAAVEFTPNKLNEM